MRWLEATPQRYEAGMRLITLGKVVALHDAVAAAATASGADVLEIGCGTGAVTRRLVERGARVTALDQDPAMLEQARRGLEGVGHAVTWLERSASEIDALAAGSFDAVVLSLSLSEMSAEARAWVLSEARTRVRETGRLVAADEVLAPVGPARAIQALLRAPQWLLGWLLAGSVSKPIPDLAAEIAAAGWGVRSERRWLLGTLALFVAEPSK